MGHQHARLKLRSSQEIISDEVNGNIMLEDMIIEAKDQFWSGYELPKSLITYDEAHSHIRSGDMMSLKVTPGQYIL